MLLPRFAYHRPQGLASALEMLGSLGAEAKLLAGGTDLLVNMKLGKLKPANLIDLSACLELNMGQSGDGMWSLGALLRAGRLAEGLGGGLPLALARGAGSLGSPQVRNRATLGGNLVTARPAADICVPLLALGASVELAGPEGVRQVELDEFFLGPGQTVLAPGEILTKALLPMAQEGEGSGYAKLGLRQAMEISLVNVAAWLRLSPDGKSIAQARVALGAVAPRPILSPGAAAVLAGAPADEKSLAAAASAAATDAKPIDDHRGSAAFRREMVAVLTRRGLAQALAQARGEVAS